MPEIPEINDSLAELEQELENFKNTAAAIQNAEKASNLVIAKAENLVNETIKKTNTYTSQVISETKALTTRVINEANVLTSKVISETEKTNRALIQDNLEINAEVIKRAQSLGHETQELSIKVKELIHSIDDVNFPTRLEKLDATVSGINIAVQNLVGRVDSVERNLKDNFEEKIKSLNNDVKKLYTGNIILFIVVIILTGIVIALQLR